MRPDRRRLAAVLFLDIVGSTALAAEIGDARFKALLTQYWRIVRRAVRAAGGRLQDPAGDGALGTFSEPAQAIRAAVAISAAVQSLGIDIRAGVHVGECEVAGSKLRGIAVHIGARVMGLAGAAELLVTGTVLDLVAGAPFEVEPIGPRELDGVPGARVLFRVVAADGTQVPQPLSGDVRRARVAALAVDGRPLRRRGTVVSAALVAAVGIGGAATWLSVGRSGAHGASPRAPVSVLEIAAVNGDTLHVVRDREGPIGTYDAMGVVDGTLWETALPAHRLIERSVTTGRVQRSFALPSDIQSWANGLGAIWFLGRRGNGAVVERIAPDSGRKTVIALPPVADTSAGGFITFGPGGVWVIAGGTTLLQIDPTTNRVRGRYALPRAATVLVARRGYLWLLPLGVDEYMLRFDPRTHRIRAYDLPERPWDVLDEPFTGLWIFDRTDATLSAFDPRTGKVSRTIGVPGSPQSAVAARASLWVAAGRFVERVDASSGLRFTFTMPRGVFAGNIALDPTTGNVWVGNSVRATN